MRATGGKQQPWDYGSLTGGVGAVADQGQMKSRLIGVR